MELLYLCLFTASLEPHRLIQGVLTPKIDTATRPFLGFSDMRHGVFLNATGRQEHFLNSTGRQELFLNSTGRQELNL